MKSHSVFPLQCDLLTEVFRLAGCGLILLNSDSKILAWNEWMDQHASMTEAQVLGRNFWECFPMVDSSRLHEAIAMAHQQGLSSSLSHYLNPTLLPLYAYPPGGKRADHFSGYFGASAPH